MPNVDVRTGPFHLLLDRVVCYTPWDWNICRPIDPPFTTPGFFSAVRLAVPWSVWGIGRASCFLLKIELNTGGARNHCMRACRAHLSSNSCPMHGFSPAHARVLVSASTGAALVVPRLNTTSSQRCRSARRLDLGSDRCDRLRSVRSSISAAALRSLIR